MKACYTLARVTIRRDAFVDVDVVTFFVCVRDREDLYRFWL